MIDRRDNPEFLNEFLDYMVSIQNKSRNTVKEYNYDLVHFFKFLLYQYRLVDVKSEKEIKEMDIQHVTNMSFDVIKRVKLQDIHAFLSYLERVYDSKATTRARKVASIRVYFNYLTAKANRLEINPTQNLESPKLGKRLPKYLSQEESMSLLTTIRGNQTDRNEERDYAITTLFLNCGMRLSELVGISLKDIDFGEAKLNVIGKGNKERTIYLNNACIRAINDYLPVRPKQVIKDEDGKEPLFVSERRQRISNRNVQKIIKEELLRAGLDTKKYSVHKLRHTAATLMYQNGVDIRALQELLGHESIATTQIYTHVNNDQIRSAVDSNPLANFEAKKG